ncbi:MAG TPA: ABC transporter permease [Acidimicrobiia bacterium]|nr:ABC transporter permease [Acidimicrobiia bacterium]
MTLIRHLASRTLRGKRLLGTGALAAVAGVAAWVSMAGITTDATADIYRTVTASVPPATLSIALLIVTSATLRDERDGGTLAYVYMSPVSAAGFALSAMTAALVTAVVISLAGWLPGWVGAGIMTGSWSLALPALSAYLLAAFGYCAVFLPLGYLFDRSLIIGLAYIFVWEGIVATAVTGVGPSSVWRIAMSGYADLDDLPPDALDVLGTVEPGIGGAIATVVVLVVVGTLVLTWAVRSRDAV